GGGLTRGRAAPRLWAGAPSPREPTVRVTRPGPKPKATHEPSLSIEASPTAVKEPPPSQSLVLLRTISELMMLICSPHGKSMKTPTSLSDTVTLVSVIDAHAISMPWFALVPIVELVKKLLPPLSPGENPVCVVPVIVIPVPENTPLPP